MTSPICDSSHISTSPVTTCDPGHMLTLCAWDCTFKHHLWCQSMAIFNKIGLVEKGIYLRKGLKRGLWILLLQVKFLSNCCDAFANWTGLMRTSILCWNAGMTLLLTEMLVLFDWGWRWAEVMMKTDSDSKPGFHWRFSIPVRHVLWVVDLLWSLGNIEHAATLELESKQPQCFCWSLRECLKAWLGYSLASTASSQIFRSYKNKKSKWGQVKENKVRAYSEAWIHALPTDPGKRVIPAHSLRDHSRP